MGDDDERALGAAQRVDAVGDTISQRVDVEARVGLVEHRQRGSSTAIWKISLRFFSPPEKPSLTERCSSAWSISSSFIFSFTSAMKSMASSSGSSRGACAWR